jgi:hypothetical protein
MHTDEMLKIFDNATVCMGSEFCTFKQNTCPHFDTKELHCKTDAQECWQSKLKCNRVVSRSNPQPSVSDSAGKDDNTLTPVQKSLNFKTYKHHALGDYPKTTCQFRTTDSFSTEPVSGGVVSHIYY